MVVLPHVRVGRLADGLPAWIRRSECGGMSAACGGGVRCYATKLSINRFGSSCSGRFVVAFFDITFDVPDDFREGLAVFFQLIVHVVEQRFD